jgi:stearoyl-CoA desaturase (Delta-9 desaturase)
VQEGGIFRAHVGSYLYKPSEHAKANVDISDIEADVVARIQSLTYPILAPAVGLAAPALIADYAWGDLMGGLMIAGLLRALLAQHTTFLVQVRRTHLRPVAALVHFALEIPSLPIR